ncbi:NADP-dependent oxidoreductase [Paenibacillus sp. P26]|nr:NADP-dependent oxidoreductase [Paenibacillus sp. P26]
MNKRDNQTMKAIRYHSFGGPEVLRCEEVPRPAAGPGQVLVRVHASGLNPGDWQIRSGLARERFPESMLPYIPGWDVSGVVDSVGPGVTGFQAGDAVYGMTDNSGACAEYVAVPASRLAPKPASISHVQAAGLPQSAVTAWHVLYELAGLAPGQRVLIHGVAGGVGHLAVQLAKLRGAYVIGVASGRHAEFLSGLGADLLIDYTTTPVERAIRDADLILDTVGGAHADRLLDALKPGGELIPITWGHYSPEHAAKAGVTVRDIPFTEVNTENLTAIAELIDSGHLRIAIDTVFPLREARRAHELSESRRVRGKIVLQVAE